MGSVNRKPGCASKNLYHSHVFPNLQHTTSADATLRIDDFNDLVEADAPSGLYHYDGALDARYADDLLASLILVIAH
jgi:hypothetical protein